MVAADLRLEAGVDMSARGRRGLILQPEEVRDIKMQSVGYSDDGFETGISLPALNSTNICTVQIHRMGKALLRVALRLAGRSQVVPEINCCEPIFHPLKRQERCLIVYGLIVSFWWGRFY
ncbi:hypothetical protein [Ruegeria sp. HKCCE3926]|uniref:hypothetical protein n=1 Tax=Ruegeria sp. HKCCE3926 TaxID=2794831 RepID=UPI0032AF14D5